MIRSSPTRKLWSLVMGSCQDCNTCHCFESFRFSFYLSCSRWIRAHFLRIDLSVNYLSRPSSLDQASSYQEYLTKVEDLLSMSSLTSFVVVTRREVRSEEILPSFFDSSVWPIQFGHDHLLSNVFSWRYHVIFSGNSSADVTSDFPIPRRIRLQFHRILESPVVVWRFVISE